MCPNNILNALSKKIRKRQLRIYLFLYCLNSFLFSALNSPVHRCKSLVGHRVKISLRAPIVFLTIACTVAFDIPTSNAAVLSPWYVLHVKKRSKVHNNTPVLLTLFFLAVLYFLISSQNLPNTLLS